MKKLTALLAAAFIGLFALAAPASASGKGGDQPAENKKITICHATASDTNPYNKIEVSVASFFNAGHIDHEQGGRKDIYPSFTYTTKGGEVVTVPAQGDQSLLAFDDCVAPKVDEKIAKPEPTYLDPCGTENDVFAVTPGRGYTVSPVAYEGNNQVITVTLEEGFAWAPDGNKQELRFVKPQFTDIDCDLPETGVGASFNTTGGYMALGALAVGGAFLVTGGRRKKATANI